MSKFSIPLFLKSKINNRILLNASILTSGNLFSSILRLISLSLITRSLSIDSFGILTTVTTFCMIIDRFFNFQSWQAIIKYGTDLLEKNNKDEFKDLILFGYFIDILTAILAFSVAFISSSIFGDIFGWSTDRVQMITLYSFIIIFHIEGTPSAVFRIFDKFKHFSIAILISSITKLILVIYGFVYEMDIWYFIFATMSSQIIHYLYFIFLSLIVLRKQNIYLNIFSISFEKIRNITIKNVGILRFVFMSNIHSSFKMSTQLVDILLVDYMFGSKSTGLYQVSKQFSQLFTKISQPLYTSIYPELTKLWSKKNIIEFRSVIKNFCFIGFLFSTTGWFILFLFGDIIIKITVGIKYLDSLDILLLYLLGSVISISTFPATPAILAMGYPQIPFKIIIFSTVAYYLSIIFLIDYFGLITMGISYLILYVSSSILLYFYFHKVFKKKLIIN